MSTSVRPNRINIDLQGYKQQWLDYCKAQNVTPSEAFRQIVAKLTAKSTPLKAADQGDEADPGKVRREIRLTTYELARAEAMAQREGFSLTRWIVALINARLHGTPQLGQQELQVLAQSNLQLLAIGRNLNQLARIANSRTLSAGPVGKGEFERLSKSVAQHTKQVAAVLSANVRRWRA